ncbi:serine O-acetyltransferase [Flavobacterium sp. WC2430]|uniref:serine O-acetyltransferase n=1 Tax=Flavobacterium sp. WC2430 TaxID=3234137 RepID=UPI0034657DE0
MFERILNLIKSFSSFVIGVLYSLLLYKKFRIYFCNHLTVGIKYLHSQKVIFPHPVGIVIGKKVVLGKNCIIYQNVTIGTKDTENYKDAAYPIIGDNVTIFANSVIFGGITIGSNSVIGCGSVVFVDVPPNSIVVGNPAKIIDNKI